MAVSAKAGSAKPVIDVLNRAEGTGLPAEHAEGELLARRAASG